MAVSVSDIFGSCSVKGLAASKTPGMRNNSRDSGIENKLPLVSVEQKRNTNAGSESKDSKQNKKKKKAEKRESSLNQRNGPKVYEPRTKTRVREKEGERDNF